MKSKTARVAVVGGGVAGLTAAAALADAGAHVTVYEAASHLGGRFATLGRMEFTHGGKAWDFPVEHGLHGFWRQYPNLRALLARLGTADHLRRAGRQALVLDSRPGRAEHIEIGEAVRGAPLPDLVAQTVLALDPGFVRAALADRPWLGMKVVADLAHPLAFNALTDLPLYDNRTVEDFIAPWPSLFQRFFAALTRSAFLREPAEISLAAFLYGLTVHAMDDKRDSAFDVLREDPEVSLFGPLRAQIENKGGRVVTGAAVRGLRLVDGRATGVVLGRRTEAADAVVLALDPSSLRALMEGGSLGAALGNLHLPEATACVAVRLFFERAPAAERAESGVFGDGPADNYFWLHRLREDFAVWHTQTGGSVVECHLYGAHADLAERQSDAEIIERVGQDFRTRWPEVGGPPVFGHVQRNRRHHPVFGPGDLSRAPGVATAVPNVALAGDWIACPLRYLFMERACVTGLLAAAHVADRVALPAGAIARPIAPESAAPSIAWTRRLLRPLRARGMFTRIRGH